MSSSGSGSSVRCANATSRVAPAEGRPPRETFVGDASERVHIGSGRGVTGGVDELRREVLGCPEQLARLGQQGQGLALGETEIREQSLSVIGEQDVGRLHVSVDEPLAVEGAEAGRDVRA